MGKFHGMGLNYNKTVKFIHKERQTQSRRWLPQSIKCLLFKNGPLNSVPRIHSQSVSLVMCTYRLSPGEVETGKSLGFTDLLTLLPER